MPSRCVACTSVHTASRRQCTAHRCEPPCRTATMQASASRLQAAQPWCARLAAVCAAMRSLNAWTTRCAAAAHIPVHTLCTLPGLNARSACIVRMHIGRARAHAQTCCCRHEEVLCVRRMPDCATVPARPCAAVTTHRTAAPHGAPSRKPPGDRCSQARNAGLRDDGEVHYGRRVHPVRRGDAGVLHHDGLQRGPHVRRHDVRGRHVRQPGALAPLAPASLGALCRVFSRPAARGGAQSAGAAAAGRLSHAARCASACVVQRPRRPLCATAARCGRAGAARRGATPPVCSAAQRS